MSQATKKMLQRRERRAWWKGALRYVRLLRATNDLLLDRRAHERMIFGGPLL